MQGSFSKPVMIVTYGYPGSGKTSFARQFAHSFKMLHISADRIRFELFDDPLFNAAEDQVINSLMNYMTEQALRSGKSFIYDRNVGVKKQRQRLFEGAEKAGFAPLIVWCQTDKSTALYRSTNRDRRRAEDRYSFPINSSLFNEMASKMTKPTEKEDFVVISGKHPLRSQTRAVTNKLAQVGVYLPEEDVVSKPAQSGRVDPSIRTLRPQDVGRVIKSNI